MIQNSPSNKSNNIQKFFSIEKVALIVIAIGVIIRIVNLGNREFWYDEVLSLLISTSNNGPYKTPGDLPVVLAQYTSLLKIPPETNFIDFLQTIRNLLRSLYGAEPHPPIFFFSQHFWLRLFGNGEAAMRSLNTLFSIAAMGAAYGLGKFLLGHRGGLFYAALIGMSPFYLFHSLNVRMYAPLVLWAILSTWALLNLIKQDNSEIPPTRKSQFLWNGVLMISLAAGFLTFYLYAYWFIILAVLALYLDRKHWFRNALRIGGGFLLTIPWILIGTLKQLRNADINRFGNSKSTLPPFLKHLQDVVDTLGTNVVIGDWATSLHPSMMTISGGLVILAFIGISIHLWKKNEKQNLITVLILGVLPLFLALIVDFATKKFTLSFGFGRTMTIIVPGCLLLIALWIEKAVNKQWRALAAVGILIVYLTISIGDFTLRTRYVFRSVAELVAKDASQTTLIAMNSKAWGHVNRLAYYIPPEYPVMLLSHHPADLAPNLEKVLAEEPNKYSRIIWLNSGDPLWARLKTEEEVKREEEKIKQILSSNYKLQETRNLSGTFRLDDFTAMLYSPM